MKIKMTVVTSVVLAMVAGAGVAQAGPFANNKTLDIHFVGYCDGMHLVINQNTGRVTGNQTGGCITNGPLSGVVGAMSALGEGIAVAVSDGAGGVFLYGLDDNPLKWSLTALDGTPLNSGTYAVGVAAAPVQGPAAAVSTLTPVQ